MGGTGPLRLAQNAHERLILWRAGRPQATDRRRRSCAHRPRGGGGADERRTLSTPVRHRGPAGAGRAHRRHRPGHTDARTGEHGRGAVEDSRGEPASEVPAHTGGGRRLRALLPEGGRGNHIRGQDVSGGAPSGDSGPRSREAWLTSGGRAVAAIARRGRDSGAAPGTASSRIRRRTTSCWMDITWKSGFRKVISRFAANDRARGAWCASRTWCVPAVTLEP